MHQVAPSAHYLALFSIVTKKLIRIKKANAIPVPEYFPDPDDHVKLHLI